MRGRVQRPSGVIAAALAERAAQRTRGSAEGGTSQPRQGTALGPAAHGADSPALLASGGKSANSARGTGPQTCGLGRPRPTPSGCAARRRPFAPGPARPQPCRTVGGMRGHACHPSAQARGQCPAGAHRRRRAAERSEGLPGAPARGRREGSMRGRVQRPSGVIAAALAERAAQRTRGLAEGGASKPRQGTALGPASLVACKTGLRQAQPERGARGLRRAQPERHIARRSSQARPEQRGMRGIDSLSPNGSARGVSRDGSHSRRC